MTCIAAQACLFCCHLVKRPAQLALSEVMVQRGLRKPEARPVGQTNNSLTLIARQEAGGAVAFQLCLLRNFEWPGRLGEACHELIR